MGLDQDSNNQGLHLVLGLSLNNNNNSSNSSSTTANAKEFTNSTTAIITTYKPTPRKPCYSLKQQQQPSLTLGLSGGRELSRQEASPLISDRGRVVLQQVKRERSAELLGEILEERVSSRLMMTDEEEEEDELLEDDGHGDGILMNINNNNNNNNNARKKLRLTKQQSALLEQSFKLHTTLNPKQKQALARQLNLRPRQVEVWFQNRRARTKLKQTEVDCEFLKKCCETLRDENRRLTKEVEELKALKLSQPLYLPMSMPAATLTMCPSCETETLGAAGSVTTDNNKTPFMAVKPPHFYNPFTNPSAACS